MEFCTALVSFMDVGVIVCVTDHQSEENPSHLPFPLTQPHLCCQEVTSPQLGNTAVEMKCDEMPIKQGIHFSGIFIVFFSSCYQHTWKLGQRQDFSSCSASIFALVLQKHVCHDETGCEPHLFTSFPISSRHCYQSVPVTPRKNHTSRCHESPRHENVLL